MQGSEVTMHAHRQEAATVDEGSNTGRDFAQALIYMLARRPISNTSP